jgi:hypothetical protein
MSKRKNLSSLRDNLNTSNHVDRSHSPEKISKLKDNEEPTPNEMAIIRCLLH